MRYLSVCSGIEAASVAWESLGWAAAGFAEIEPFPSRVLHHHFGCGRPRVMPDPLEEGLSEKDRRARRAAAKAVAKIPDQTGAAPNFGDFTTIDLNALGPVDVLVGGTPCQAFSVAGKRLSLADARGNLSLAYAVLAHELARSHGLRFAVWENVPGVLSTKDNAFGCFLGELVGSDSPLVPPRGLKWTDAGLVAGPKARAAWRIMDAQYFGLAQRRERVFVVVGFGEGADPAAVLLEWASVWGNSPPRREEKENIARPIAAGSPGGSGYRNDADTADNLIVGTLCANKKAAGSATNQDAQAGLLIAHALRAQPNCSHREDQDTLVPVPHVYSIMPQNSGRDYKARHVEVAQPLMAGAPVGGNQGGDYVMHPVAFGGNNTSGPIEVAAALNAHGGPCGRQDFESETFIAHTLRGDGFDASEDGTGRGTRLVPVCFDPRQADVLVHGDRTGPLDTKFPGPAIAFDTTPITSATNRCNPQPGDPCHPLAAGAHPPAIAFTTNQGAHNADAEEARSVEALFALLQAIGEEAFLEWRSGVEFSFREAKVLRRDLHGSGIRREANEGDGGLDDGALSREKSRSSGALRELWEAGCKRRPPQGRGLSQQHASQLGEALSRLPYEASPPAWLYYLRAEAQGSRLLQSPLHHAQGGATWAVRRLTPREAERLQGFQDDWTAIPGAADGPRYKALGNSMAVPCMAWIGRRIAAVLGLPPSSSEPPSAA